MRVQGMMSAKPTAHPVRMHGWIPDLCLTKKVKWVPAGDNLLRDFA